MTKKKQTAKAFYKVLDGHQLQVLRGVATQADDETFEVHVKDYVLKGKDEPKTFATKEQAMAYIGGEFVATTEEEYDKIMEAFADGTDPRSDAFAEKPYSGDDVSAKTEQEQDEARAAQDKKLDAERTTENQEQDAGGNVGPAYPGPVAQEIDHPVMAKPE